MRRALVIALLLCAAPAHAAKTTSTWPRWSADSTGAPVEGFPARWAYAQIDYQFDERPRARLYNLTVTHPGALDGRRMFTLYWPEGAYQRALGVWVRTADEAGNWSPWAEAWRRK